VILSVTITPNIKNHNMDFKEYLKEASDEPIRLDFTGDTKKKDKPKPKSKGSLVKILRKAFGLKRTQTK